MNSLYHLQVIKMGKITKKEEIELLLDKLETELSHLPFHGPKQQRRHYKFGQYITGLNESVNEATRTFQELQKKVTDLLYSLDTNPNVKEK